MSDVLKVGFDAHMVGSQETGNETYARGLVDGLAGLDGDFTLSVYHVGRPWRPDDQRLHFKRLLSGSPFLRLTAELPLQTVRDRLDVLHTTYAAPVWTRCPVVLTVHDICYATHPEWFSPRDRSVLSATVPWSIRRAARVITVSETCRSEIIEHYRVPEDKVVSVYNGAGLAAEPLTAEAAAQELVKLGLDPARLYLLAVGNLQPRKNLTRLMEAFRRLLAQGADIDLVIAGPQHYRGEEILSAAHGTSERIRFTGYLSAVQLAACYRRAEVFVYPSLFEGFGLPPLEAMAQDVPVVCSRAGALPEVCGPAAHYFDPLDVESMAAALREALEDSDLRARLVKQGQTRVKQFSWARSAELTLNVYREAISDRAVRQTGT